MLITMMTAIALATNVELPPARYDHEPSVTYTVQYVSPAQIEKKCKSVDLMLARLKRPDINALGCTMLDGSNKVYIDKTLSDEDRALVLRHEKGHVNGWRH